MRASPIFITIRGRKGIGNSGFRRNEGPPNSPSPSGGGLGWGCTSQVPTLLLTTKVRPRFSQCVLVFPCRGAQPCALAPGSGTILSWADTGARPSTCSGVRPYAAGPSRQIASNTNTRWEYHALTLTLSRREREQLPMGEPNDGLELHGILYHKCQHALETISKPLILPASLSALPFHPHPNPPPSRGRGLLR